jgi:hypothetical protein
MKKSFLQCLATVLIAGFTSCSQQSSQTNSMLPETVTMTKEQLMDKIKGGWAAQTIGVTYGGPTEFRYRSAMIQDYVPIGWNDGCIKGMFDHFPALYDDIYMDLTFVEVFERVGIDAPVDSFAHAFAYADYGLWHANAAARYNIMQGIMPPASGHWLNNPHADDIDYQIEADFAGLMTPGMPNTQSEISDKIGHIMNYGDGWYGGVYVGAMYSLAFVSDDIHFVVNEALKTIPSESRYYKCMTDVINMHKQYPNDWKQAWAECEKRWNQDIGCPEGTLMPYNIDAVINSAYVLIGLLYGEGDFFKTMDIATRCGQDSDCNPATAVGILATMQGYSKIPEYWMKALRMVEDRNFAYTNMSLNKTYETSFKHALQMIERNGGKVSENEVTIACQTPKAVQLEQCFEGIFPIGRRAINKTIEDNKEFKTQFEGTGYALTGSVRGEKGYVARVEIYIDDQLEETLNLPSNKTLGHRVDLAWKYLMPKGKHSIALKWLNPKKDVHIKVGEMLIYSDGPQPVAHQ